MLEIRLEACFERTMADVFTALVHELAQGRWSAADEALGRAAVPRPGLRFGYRQARRLYCGEVLECLRPVSIVLVERYCGPAVAVVARQRWHVDPLESATRLRGHVRVETNRFARFQSRFWKAHFSGRARRTCSQVARQLRSHARAARIESALPEGRPGHSGTTGQNTGNTSIVSANTNSVSGKPIFR